MLKTKNNQEYAIGQLSLDDKKDLDNSKLWVIAEEGAQDIEKIYNLHKSIIIQKFFECTKNDSLLARQSISEKNSYEFLRNFSNVKVNIYN